MSKHKVVHFEIPMSDAGQSKAFYERAFGWKMSIEGDGGEYLMATAGPAKEDGSPSEPGNINGGFYKRKSKKDAPSVVIETDSIDETAKAIEKAGGTVTNPKHPIGEWGFMADFTDPDGNALGLWEKAK